MGACNPYIFLSSVCTIEYIIVISLQYVCVWWRRLSSLLAPCCRLGGCMRPPLECFQPSLAPAADVAHGADKVAAAVAEAKAAAVAKAKRRLFWRANSHSAAARVLSALLTGRRRRRRWQCGRGRQGSGRRRCWRARERARLWRSRCRCCLLGFSVLFDVRRKRSGRLHGLGGGRCRRLRARGRTCALFGKYFAISRALGVSDQSFRGSNFSHV